MDTTRNLHPAILEIETVGAHHLFSFSNLPKLDSAFLSPLLARVALASRVTALPVARRYMLRLFSLTNNKRELTRELTSITQMALNLMPILGAPTNQRDKAAEKLNS